MPESPDQRYDFFLSRRGSVAAVAREVADVLNEKGYKVLVQDYDIPLGASFVEAMHEAVKNSRDLVVLFTRDYEQSPYTRKEFTSFEAQRLSSIEDRHTIVLRCEDVPLEGLFADTVYQDLVGISDPEERKRRIISAAERHSQAARPPPKPFIGVPPRIATFTGRADELDRLDAILMKEKPAAVTQSVGRAAVEGLGGVGKTSLATEYAHRFRQLYAGVCWCPAETRTGLLTSLTALAVTLGAATADEADVETAAKAALRRLGEQRATWLLIYDNVPSPAEISALLPSAGARVLITSRFSDWSAWADEVSLEVLPVREAVEFLQSRTGRQDAEGAQTLAEALGCLPLALDHAAAYCKQTQMSFAEYAAKASNLIAQLPRGVGYPNSVTATFDLAITQAVAQCGVAEALMAFIAQCAPERIPMSLLEGAVGDKTERLGALAALAVVSLIKHDPFEDGTPAITVHRLVQAVAKRRTEASGNAHHAIERLVSGLATVFPITRFDDASSWPVCAQLTPHIITLHAAHALETSTVKEWLDLLNSAGAYLHGRASYEEAETLLREGLAIRQRLLGPDHPDVASSLNNLGLLLTHRGDLKGARPLLERSLAIDEKVFGSNHPRTATALNNLAYLMQLEEDFSGARPLMERALEIRENAFGAEHPDTAMSYNNLAYQRHQEGDLVAAEALYRRALDLQERVWGIHHHHTVQTLNNLACLLRDKGDLATSQPLMERALAMYEAILGPEHPNTNVCRYQMVRLLLASGQLSDALALGEQTLSISIKVLGPEHKSTRFNTLNVAEALHKLGRIDEAREVLKRYGVLVPKEPTTTS